VGTADSDRRRWRIDAISRKSPRPDLYRNSYSPEERGDGRDGTDGALKVRYELGLGLLREKLRSSCRETRVQRWRGGIRASLTVCRTSVSAARNPDLEAMTST